MSAQRFDGWRVLGIYLPWGGRGSCTCGVTFRRRREFDAHDCSPSPYAVSEVRSVSIAPDLARAIEIAEPHIAAGRVMLGIAEAFDVGKQVMLKAACDAAFGAEEPCEAEKANAWARSRHEFREAISASLSQSGDAA